MGFVIKTIIVVLLYSCTLRYKNIGSKFFKKLKITKIIKNIWINLPLTTGKYNIVNLEVFMTSNILWIPLP